ncbi:MAG: murein hydrolase activator EnvC family protein [Acetivibrionales bacterium]|jgi:murein DD-endopeptidase MepM/ murein hydrolase activator NlpD
MKRLVTVVIVISLLVASAVPVVADELSKVKSQKTYTDNRISELKKKQNEELKKKSQLEQEKKKIATEQANENNAYQELLKQVRDAEENLRQTEAALAEAVANYNKQRELVKTRLKIMYKNSGTTMLDTLLESKSVIEFYERLQYMSVISRYDNNMIEELNNARQEVEYKKKLQQQAKENLERKVNEKEERLSRLKTSRAQVENEIARSKAAIDKLEKEIDAQIAESKRLESVIKNLSTRKKYVGGSMVWPVPSSYTITSYYGMRKHPILRKYKMHTGIDIAASKGASIVAANSGTVIMSHYDKSGGYGNMVVIDHGDGITTLYAHASKLLVKVGDEVKAGQTIAKVGSTGLSTGNHLHFEVRVNGVTKNPLSSGWLSK